MIPCEEAIELSPSILRHDLMTREGMRGWLRDKMQTIRLNGTASASCRENHARLVEYIDRLPN